MTLLVSGKQNLLHLLANRNQNLPVFEHYLDKGLDANAQDARGIPPFECDTWKHSRSTGFVHAAEDINVKDNKGQSAHTIESSL